LSRIAAADKAPLGAFFMSHEKNVVQEQPTLSTPTQQPTYLKNSSGAIS
jgi:hypothetical protein